MHAYLIPYIIAVWVLYEKFTCKNLRSVLSNIIFQVSNQVCIILIPRSYVEDNVLSSDKFVLSIKRQENRKAKGVLTKVN